MKKFMAFLLLVVSLCFCVSQMLAQTATRDVVHLKNGSIIKGTIIELIPNATVKIQTADGSLFVYTMSEIEKIEKESDTAPSAQGIVTHPSTQENVPTKVSIFGGVALPVGEFADETNGGAKTGYTAGIQIVGGGQVGFLINASYSSNPTNIGQTFASYFGSGVNAESGNWSSILALAGAKFGTNNASGANFFFAPLIGVNVGMSPKVTFSITSTQYQSLSYYPYYQYVTVTSQGEMKSATGTALAYGAMAELNVGGFVLGARYIASKPKYKVETSYSTGSSFSSSSTDAEQNTAIIQIYAGLTF